MRAFAQHPRIHIGMFVGGVGRGALNAESHDLFGMPNGKRPEQQGADRRENQRVCPDAEREQ